MEAPADFRPGDDGLYPWKRDGCCQALKALHGHFLQLARHASTCL